jgi:predicted NAD-dependent protein-ADP-ribosyltransferase YbiA (DUF1768 family)
MFYEENRKLEEEDIGIESPVYNITIYDKSFIIAIGNERRLIQKKNTFYFPIYLLNKIYVLSQIGAFEYESSKDVIEDRIKPFLDSSGDIDVNRLGDPILYSFANFDYFESLTNTITPIALKELESVYIEEKSSKKMNDLKDDIEEDITIKEPRPFELTEDDMKPLSESSIKTNKVLKNGVFTINKTNLSIPHLSEETKEIAKDKKESYIESKSSKWIEKYMKNNHYDFVETLSNGDCLFDTIRLAYEQIGYETDIKKLRALVAKEVTKEKFMTYRELYTSTVAEIVDTDKQLRGMIAENKNLKERLSSLPQTDKQKRAEIIRQANDIKKQHDVLKKKQIENHKFLEEFSHMKGIDTIDKFQNYILTPDYWADDWAIEVLERELNIKLIIFSEGDYEEDDENNVIRCTFASHNSKTDIFTPDFYVMTTYSGNHYRLITYDNKRIFNFREIPYDVKSMVIIKCMERNSGLFAQIYDFKEWKRKLGVGSDGDDESEDEEEPEELKRGGGFNRLDKSTIFIFYDKSNSNNKPGKAANESISPEKIHEYTELSLNKNWRKKLDDDWVSTFELDNKKWKTVEHYYQAAKFKKHNPHFYNRFSLDDTSSEIAKEVVLAKAAGSQNGSFKKGKRELLLRPVDIKIDPDFYSSRKKEEREKALYAKFSQNEELKNILLLTKNAFLKHFIPKRKPEQDGPLMMVRQRLSLEQ